jgi:hypothetical protein
MVTARVLFWLGIVVGIVEFLSYLRNMVIIPHSLLNIGILGSAFWQGGSLVGLAKIIEAIHNNKR